MQDIAFDDLIPVDGGGRSRPGPHQERPRDPPVDLSFDDLIPAKTAKRKRSVVENVTGFMSKVNRGLGIGDELAAGADFAINALSGRQASFSDSLAKQRATEDTYQAEHPHYAAAATGIGNALTMAAPVGPGAQAFATGGRAVNALRGATVAGLSGAGYAAVDRGSLGERAAAAATAAQDPLTLALGGGFGALAKPRAQRVKPAVPTLEDLTAQKNDAYGRVRASGESYSSDQFRSLADDMTSVMAAEGFNPGNHPKAAAKLDQISNTAHRAAEAPMSIEELDQLRQQIGRDVASSPDEGERRMGTIMRNAIDDFIERAGGSPDLLEARELNTRVTKLRNLDQLDDKAARRASRTGSGGNKENALRQNVDRFIDDTGNLSPAEAEAARRVVDGTPTGNVLRQVGKLSPEGNGLGFAVHAVGGVTSHGATLPLAAGGFVAKRVSEALTRRNVQALRDIIATGGEAAQEVSRQLADPRYAEIRAQLASDLAVQSGVAGVGQRPPIEVTVGQSTNPEHLAWRRAQGLD